MSHYNKLKNIKVLILKYSETGGGIAQVLDHQLAVLREADIKTILVTIGNKKLADNLRQTSYKTYHLNSTARQLSIILDHPFYAYKEILQVLKLQSEIYDIAKDENVDIMHAHRPGFALVCARAVHKKHIPLIIGIHSIPQQGRWRDIIRKKVTSIILNRNCAYVYGVAHAAIDKYAADLKVHHGVLYNAVPSMIQSGEIGQKLCNRDDLLDSTLIIGTIGRIKPGKGYEIFIEAAHILLKRNIALRFVIAGEPSSPWQEKYYSSLKQQVQKLGIEENVFFAGYMSQEEFMSCADIVCNPSYSHIEVCSMVILEAFAARRPVVATRLGGTPELIRDGTNGLLTLPGDAEGLAKNLDILIQDAELRKKLGSSAYRIYQERYNLKIWKENLIDLYAKYCRRN